MKLLNSSLFIFALTLSLFSSHAAVAAVDAALRIQVLELAVRRADLKMSEFMVASGVRTLTGTKLLFNAPLDLAAMDCQLKVLSTFAEQLDLILVEADKMEYGGGNHLLKFLLQEGKYREIRFPSGIPDVLLSEVMTRFWSTLDIAEQMSVANRFSRFVDAQLLTQEKVEDMQIKFKRLIEHTLTGTVNPPPNNSTWMVNALITLAQQPATTARTDALLRNIALKLK